MASVTPNLRLPSQPFVFCFTFSQFYCWQCCLLILYILFCCLHCDCLGLAAIKWFLTASETLNLLTYLQPYDWNTILCTVLQNITLSRVKHATESLPRKLLYSCIFKPGREHRIGILLSTGSGCSLEEHVGGRRLYSHFPHRWH